MTKNDANSREAIDVEEIICCHGPSQGSRLTFSMQDSPKAVMPQPMIMQSIQKPATSP